MYIHPPLSKLYREDLDPRKPCTFILSCRNNTERTLTHGNHVHSSSLLGTIQRGSYTTETVYIHPLLSELYREDLNPRKPCTFILSCRNYTERILTHGNRVHSSSLVETIQRGSWPTETVYIHPLLSKQYRKDLNPRKPCAFILSSGNYTERILYHGNRVHSSSLVGTIQRGS